MVESSPEIAGKIEQETRYIISLVLLANSGSDSGQPAGESGEETYRAISSARSMRSAAGGTAWVAPAIRKPVVC
jgi:hypothetical protein